MGALETGRASSATGYTLRCGGGPVFLLEKGKEVRTNEKAHFGVDRGADVGADDVIH
jgi:hypothetical protein